MHRNVRIYLALETLLAATAGFILPVFVLYYRYYQVTLFEIAILAVAAEGSTLLFELPTGMLADKYGRKKSSICGFFLLAVSGVIFLAWTNFYGFLIAELFFGAAEAFISGAAEALAVDSLPAENRNDQLPRLYIIRSRLRITVLVLAMVAAGYLFSEFMAIVFLPLVVAGGAGVVLSFYFKEIISSRQDSSPHTKNSLVGPLKIMVKRLNASSLLLVVFILALVSNFSFEGVDQYWQVLSTEIFDLNPAYFGLITAAGAILAFLLVGPLTRRFSDNLSLPFLILFLAGVLISSLPNSPLSLLPVLLILYFAVKELVNPLLGVIINSRIDSHGRATFLSGFNMACSVGEVGSGLIVGSIAATLGLPLVFIICGGVLVLFVFGSLILQGLSK